MKKPTSSKDKLIKILTEKGKLTVAVQLKKF